jgi:hypothetical protein
MTPWTDERLVTLLTDTFAAHESVADPAVAQRIAVTAAPRRRWPLTVAVAAAVVLVSGLTVYAVRATEPPPAPSPAPAIPLPVVPVPIAEGRNRSLADAEARHVLADIPVPPGSTRSGSAPTRELRRLGAYNGPVDRSLTRTAWWVVPLSYTDLVAWYDAHSPADVASTFAPDASSPAPHATLDWEASTPSEAYSQPAAAVSYIRRGPHITAIRTDATLAARYDRTAETLVPGTVTSIDITKSAIDGEPRPPSSDATVTDPTRLTSIVSTFNDLPGAVANAEPGGCGSPVGIVYVYAVTFRWPGHTLAVDAGTELCGIGRGLTLDGTELTPTLENSEALDQLLDEAVG